VICTTCNQPKTTAEISKLPGRRFGLNGPGLSNRCKLCIAESSKRSIRTYKIMPKFVKDVNRWPRVKVESEIAWLEEKLAVLRRRL
jgi:hypothetical protein